jgi:hypothetical protein
MWIGAAIAGLVIVSLLMEALFSSPKAIEEHGPDAEQVK